MEVTMDISHDFSLQSMLSSGHDDFNFHINISDNETFSNEISGLSVSPTPMHSDAYMDDFLTRQRSLIEKNASIWKESPNVDTSFANTANRRANNTHDSVVIVVDNNVESDEPEIDSEPFDYSIFLNKPSSPNKEDENTNEIPIQDTEEVVSDQHCQHVIEEKMEEFLNDNQVCFGNVVPKMIKMQDDGFFHCDLCSLKFNRKGNYKRHRLTHFVKSKKTPYRYQCAECSRNFLQNCDLQRHMHTHRGTHPYKCDVCDNGYLRRKDLEVHMSFHRGEKNHKCTQCDKAFFSRGDLSRHIRSSHRSDEKLKCGHCSHRFSRESTLLQHMHRKHNEMILSAFKEQCCKLQELPSVVEVDSIPFKVSTMTSPVTSGKVVTPAALLQSVLSAADDPPEQHDDSPTATSTSVLTSSTPTVAVLTSPMVTASPVTALITTSASKLPPVPTVIPFIDLSTVLPTVVSASVTSLTSVTSVNTLTDNVLTSPVRVDVLTSSQVAKTETVPS